MVYSDVEDAAGLKERLRVAEIRLEELIGAEKDLRECNRRLEEFAAVASHDLLEPLRMIAAFLGLLQRHFVDSDDTRAQHYIELANDGARRAQELVKALLELHRIDHADVKLRPVELKEVIHGVLRMLSPQITESRAVITHDDMPAVMGDGALLAHLFQNLISNAIKFAQHGSEPRLHIAVACAADHWRLSFQDHGIGIPLEDHARIFEPLQRLHSQRECPGAGLGLAICASIVARHGGRIWVESRPGSGSTFHVTVPKYVPPLLATKIQCGVPSR